MIRTGDCVEVMAGMEPESVDAIVCDPPYDLTSTGARNGSPRNPGTGPYSRGFMGKAWDGTGVAFRPETWAEAYRVAKPSAYLLAFAGTRTVHRMTCAIEDAGWIIRDMLVWAYASGFPKSKASLKPAWEPIVMARKPGPLRMLAIDECRIEANYAEEYGETWLRSGTQAKVDDTWQGPAEKPMGSTVADRVSLLGRWPANVILTDAIFDGAVEGVVGGGWQSGGGNPAWRSAEALDGSYHGNFAGGDTGLEPTDTAGTYSRFFLIPKADRTDREPILGGLATQATSLSTRGETEYEPGDSGGLGYNRIKQRANVHPTVKPTELMRHLVRLVTPPGGTVLDPFLGSGTTAIAAELEGFPWIGIEKEPEYVAIAEARLNGTQRGMGLAS